MKWKKPYIFLNVKVSMEQLISAVALTFGMAETSIGYWDNALNRWIEHTDAEGKVALLITYHEGDFPLEIDILLKDKPENMLDALIHLCEKLGCFGLIHEPEVQFTDGFILLNRLRECQRVKIDPMLWYTQNILQVIEYGELLEEVN